MKDYIVQRKSRYPDFFQMHLDEICKKDTVDLYEEIQISRQTRNKFPVFSLDYMYHWSIMTYLQDALDRHGDTEDA